MSNPVSGWEKLAVLATLIEAIVVILSISLIKSQLDLQNDQVKLQTNQLRQQTDLARAANIQSFAAVSIPMIMEEGKSGELASLVLDGDEGFKPGVRHSDEEIKRGRY